MQQYTSEDCFPEKAQAHTHAKMSETKEVSVAIIGSGIIGSVLALGLIRSNIKVQVYEQARSLREIGAGIAFTANARRCLGLIDPRLDDCVTSVGTVNGDPANPNNNMQFIDGYTYDPVKHHFPGDDLVGKTLYKLHAGPRGFEGCHRAHFLERVMKLIPDGIVHLSKRLDVYHLPSHDRNGSDGENRKIKLVFCDGSTAEADIGMSTITSTKLDRARARRVLTMSSYRLRRD